ncbi:MAG: hypothetical protein NTY30_01340 [Candidatus Berkelbacteria bacterium]|nr:hypothetical protein [Candidatus Berkelbacteria bacterium]
MKPKIKPRRSNTPRKTKKHESFQMSPWVPEKGKYETNIGTYPVGDDEHYVYPIYVCGQYKPERTGFFLRISPSLRVFFHHQFGSVELKKLPLNLADTVEFLVDGVARASTTLLGKLTLMTTNRDDNIVYIVAEKIPVPPVMTGLKPASQLTLLPA